MSAKLWLVALLLSLLVGLLQIAYFYPALPEMMPTHFDAKGNADGFDSRWKHSITMLGLQFFCAALCGGLAFALPSMPDSMINMPHKEYWLHPERRLETMQRMKATILVVAMLTQGLMLALNQLITWQALGGSHMRWFWLVLAVYMLAVGGLVVWHLLVFRPPSEARR